MRATLIDLDEKSTEPVLITELDGVRVALTRDRVHELLRREADYLALLTRGNASEAVPPRAAMSASRAPEPSQFAFHAHALPREAVTHASLSTRIKKIFVYSVPNRRLRAAHVGLLTDLITNFDWVIPEHATTKLDRYLQEMVGWRDIPDAFRLLATSFLERYGKARQQR